MHTNQDDLIILRRRYGEIMQMVKLLVVADISNNSDLFEAGIALWKATRLPINFIADIVEVDKKALALEIEERKKEWQLNGVPKNDILGEVFNRYFPELTCIRFTLKEITEMEDYSEIRIGDII